MNAINESPLSFDAQFTEEGKLRYFNILQQAKTTFAMQGYHRFSLRNIAKKANLSLTDVEYYFPSKEALLLSLIDYEIHTYNRVWQTLLANKQSQDKGISPLVPYVEHLLTLHSDPTTSGFSLQLWALAHQNVLIGEKKKQFYTGFLHKIHYAFSQIRPDFEPQQIHTQSLLIASLVEGALIFIAEKSATSEEVMAFKQAIIKQLVNLLEPTPSN